MVFTLFEKKERILVLISIVTFLFGSIMVVSAAVTNSTNKTVNQTNVETPQIGQMLQQNITSYLNGEIDPNEEIEVIIRLKTEPHRETTNKIKEKYRPEIQKHANDIKQIIKKYMINKSNSTNKVKNLGMRFSQALNQKDKNKILTSIKLKNQIKKEQRKEIVEEISKRNLNDQQPIINDIITSGGEILSNFLVTNTVVVKISVSKIIDFVDDSRVEVMELKRVAPALALNVSPRAIKAQFLWIEDDPPANGPSPIAVISIVDTGVDITHSGNKFLKNGSSRIWYRKDFSGAGLGDNEGHGTHVAGIVDSGNNTYDGTMYDISTMLDAKVSNTGSFDEINVLKAVNWSLYDADELADVVSFSAGYTNGTQDGTDPLTREFDDNVDISLATIVVAAGNEGSSGSKTLRRPGDAYNVITVGSIDDNNTESRNDDMWSSFSSRGPTDDNRKKPDIVAPGTNIFSLRASGTSLSGCNVLDTNIIECSGTSMATPHISAAAAWFDDVFTDTIEIKVTLITSAEDLGDPGWDEKYGWGYVNLLSASDLYFENKVEFESNFDDNDIGYHKVTDIRTSDVSTIVWLKHQGQNLNNLDMYLYDESDGSLINASISTIDNVEQVVSDDAYDNAVIKVKAGDTFTGTEDYAIASEAKGIDFTVNPPTLSISITNPSSESVGKAFNISGQISPTGSLNAHGVSATLNLHSGLTIVSGSNPQSLGTINDNTSKTATWTINSTEEGTKNFNVSVTSSSYGETHNTSDSSSINISPPSPTINSISAIPSQQGFGQNVTIETNITDPNGTNDIDTVLVGITPPSETETNHTMNYLSGDIWQLNNFTDFTNGTYSFTVYANDSAGLTDSSSGTFEIFVNFRTQIHTLNDTYSENEFVKLTDPPNLISRTASTDVYDLGNGKRNLILYSGIRNVFENEGWKRVEEARSLKNKGFNVIYLERDPELILDVIDFNYSSITYLAKVKGSKISKPIPIKIYRQNHTFNEIEWKGNNPGKKVTWKVKAIKQSEQIHIFNRIGNQSEELIETTTFGLDYYLEFGGNSTTIILQDADTENLDDTWTEELDNPSLNHGGDTTLFLDDTRHWRPYLKFDIQQIPSDAIINEAYLYGYGKHQNGPNTPVNIYHVYDHTWKEDVIVHSTQPCGANFDDSGNCNLTAEDTLTFAGENQWNIFNITNAVKTEYADNDDNVSMALKSDDGSSFGQQSINSKENSNITARPYLNITSSGGKTTPEENQSKIVNDGPTNASVYLLMKVQFFDSGTWLDEAIIINDTGKRTITNGETLALDTIWNPNAWNTSTRTHGSGTYRVYVAATDENDIVLKNKDGTDIEATYNFILSIPDTIAPFINILDPVNNTIYQETSIDLNWTANETLDWCAYSLDGGANNSEICVQLQGLDGWDCRNEITLQNNFSVDMISAPIRINVMKDLPDFNADDFNDGGSDIRFTDNQSNNLSSFVEVWDETNEQTIVWVNSTISANSNTTILLYHCNENANAYNNYDFMNSFENFTSGSTPSDWQVSGNAAFNDETNTLTSPFSAYFISGNDANNFNPPLPPSTNYTIDFYYYVNSSQIVDNGYWHDGGKNLLRWESSVPNNQPEVQFSCTNSSGNTLAVSEALTDRWIRMEIIRQRAPESSSDKSLNHTRIRVYDNETFYNICNGTVAGFGTSQSRLQWSFSGGNGGANKLRIENFKMYKNFGWNTSDLTIYSDNKFSVVTQQNITLTDLSEGTHNITIYGNDSSGNMGQSDYVYFNVTLPDQFKFFIKNSTGNNIAWFGDAGNIVIKGNLEQNSNFQRTDNFAFSIENNDEFVLIIENNGSMYIDGTLAENQASLTSLNENNDFRILDSSDNLVSFINETGYAFLKGTLTENGNP